MPPKKRTRKRRKRKGTRRKKKKPVESIDLKPSSILSVVYVNDSGVYHFYFENKLIRDVFTDYVLTSGFIAAVMTFSKESLNDTPSLIKMSNKGLYLHLCTAIENTLCILTRQEIPQKYLSILDFLVRKYDVIQLTNSQQIEMMKELRDVIHEIDPAFILGEREIAKWVVVSPKDGLEVTEKEIIEKSKKKLAEASHLLDELDNL
ncbi:MAG: hypothetical protein ACFFCQ_06465 [Promethearchaeota archaeon]